MGNSVQLPAKGWKPRWYQLPLWKYMAAGGKRAVVVWPRRHGKDYTAINWTAVASQLRVGTYWIVYPYLNQGRRIAWTGMSKDGNKFLDSFPKELIARRQNAEMRLELKNGSVIQIMGADEPDRFVGSNPVGIVFSEWPLMNPLVWKLTSPILAENEGWAMWIYTPRGTNHGLDMLNTARTTKGWFHSKLTAKDCKVLTAEDLKQARDELKDDSLFQQEFFTSFEVSLQGAYYQNQFKQIFKDRRIGEVAIDPLLPVTTAWDLGMSDATSIWFCQQLHSEIRLVDYYENSNEGLAHYINYLRDWAQEHNVSFKNHLAPHDIKVKELGTGESRLEAARKAGLRFRPVPKLSLQDGIEACRNTLANCYFDKVRTKHGVNALKSYSKKWSEENQTFSTRPDHNWASHGADAFRTLAVGLRKSESRVSKMTEEARMAQVEYDIFA